MWYVSPLKVLLGPSLWQCVMLPRTSNCFSTFQNNIFLVKCKYIHSTKDDDGLDSLVSALPPSYTSRFGEIVWAAGGVGFGWWPACIYDPRLTVGGARQLARKNLGKKHLVYFFECNDAPFTVLNENRLTKWDEGFLEEYDLGKVAKSGSKGRSVLFERALQMAMMENGRPIELRMDWNHQAENQPKIHKARPSGSPINQAESQPPNKKQKPSHHSKDFSQQLSIPSKSLPRMASFSPISKITSDIEAHSNFLNSAAHERQPSAVNRKNLDLALHSLSTHSRANEIEPSEDGLLVCKILRRLQLGSNSRPAGGLSASETIEFSNNVGFITLSSRQNATFACIRRAMENDFDEDCFPMAVSKNKKERGWKFYVPKLGPVSVKQEEKLGPVLKFLKSTTNDIQLGDGTASNPLKVVIMDW